MIRFIWEILIPIFTSMPALWLCAFGVTYLLVPRVIKLYRRHGWDKPHSGHRQGIKDTHHGQIPRGGGLAIFGGISFTAIAFMLFLRIIVMLVGVGVFSCLFGGLSGRDCILDELNPSYLGNYDKYINSSVRYDAIILAALLLVIVGFLDDILDLKPYPRLIVNIIAACIVIAGGVIINYVTNPFGGVLDLTSWSWIPPTLTIFYIVALTNIVNWSKGIDGQMPGTVAIAAAWVGVLSLREGFYTQAAPLAFIVSGSFAGFLIWNFYPQKIMPGYGGGSLAGFLLAVISIMAGAKIATLFMVLALPIADATFTILRRFIAGKSIFLGDRGHLHHKLLDRLHWGRRRIAVFYWCTTLLMGILAQVLPTWGKIAAFLLVSGLVFAFLIYMKLSSQTAQKVV